MAPINDATKRRKLQNQSQRDLIGEGKEMFLKIFLDGEALSSTKLTLVRLPTAGVFLPDITVENFDVLFELVEVLATFFVIPINGNEISIDMRQADNIVLICIYLRSSVHILFIHSVSVAVKPSCSCLSDGV